MTNRILTLVILVVFLASCNQEKVDQLTEDNKVAENQIERQDSVLNDMLKSFNEIQSNLREIREREGVMRMRSIDGGQESTDIKQSISEDITAISKLMNQNEEMINNLNARLKASNVQLSEFQKLITNLNGQLATKNQEIERVKSLLSDSELEVGKLYFMLDSLNFSNQMKERKIEDQEETINTAYYAYGTYKELKEKNVLTKEGGLLGIGGKEDLKNNFNKEYFSKIDIREQTSFLIYAKKAELVTNHPDKSYEFKGKDGVDSLVILNPKEFWRASKYCVIVVD